MAVLLPELVVGYSPTRQYTSDEECWLAVLGGNSKLGYHEVL